MSTDANSFRVTEIDPTRMLPAALGLAWGMAADACRAVLEDRVIEGDQRWSKVQMGEPSGAGCTVALLYEDGVLSCIWAQL